MSESPKAHVYEPTTADGHCAECGHNIVASWHYVEGKQYVTLERELAEAREKVTTLQAAVMAHKTWENEAVAQASNANFGHNKIRKELAAERIENTRLREAFVTMERACNTNVAEVERAARWFYNRGAKEWREMDFAAAWARYQQERQA